MSNEKLAGVESSFCPHDFGVMATFFVAFTLPFFNHVVKEVRVMEEGDCLPFPLQYNGTYIPRLDDIETNLKETKDE